MFHGAKKRIERLSGPQPKFTIGFINASLYAYAISGKIEDLGPRILQIKVDLFQIDGIFRKILQKHL